MWSKYKIDDEQIYTAKAGLRRFWIQRFNSFWRIAYGKEDQPDFSIRGLEVVKSLPSDLVWSHLVAGRGNSLILQPALPDRAVVIKPEESIALLPSMKLEIIIKIPLWIQLYSSSVKPENLILEFPSIELSSTWFGDTDNGELAYHLPAHIIFNLKQNAIEKYEAVCPVKIHNESPSSINFQRLSIHADQLTLYSNGEFFCTNELRVFHREEEPASDVQIVGGSPSLAEGMRQFSGARMKPNMNLLRKSFHLIKSITHH
jgi:hypothetical protein